ncbi:MAG TPA: hypothetical protein VFN52_05765 [Acidiferrobacteraceae bacterium]|nr:hypothetical protein [Acidiferrobacteraceae bacterium]
MSQIRSEERHYDTVTLDRWHCGLLPPADARMVAAHVGGCPRCQQIVGFGARVTQSLGRLRLPARAARTPRARPPRAVAAAALMAALTVTGVLVVPRWSAVPQLPPPRAAQVSDVVQHQHFYEWLATHPQLLEERGHAASA